VGNGLDEVGLVGARGVQRRSGGKGLGLAAHKGVGGAKQGGQSSHGELIEDNGQSWRLNGSFEGHEGACRAGRGTALGDGFWTRRT
jgi:hypothetical protein